MPPAMMGNEEKIDEISKVAKDYYDSDNAFNFYRQSSICSTKYRTTFNPHQVWGGEHIHVGLYTKLEGDDAKLEGVPRITKASSLTTDALLSLCFPEGSPPASESTMMDMGSGYGGTARVAAKTLGCKVVCINVASRENEINAALSKDAGLEDKVIIPGEKSFFETGMPDASCDVVTSQDALLHAGSERHRALGEAARVLKPGGRMVFSDIMQSEEADAKDLKEVYQRIHLDDMATPTAYTKWGRAHGLEYVEFTDLTANIVIHYGSVREVLVSQRGKLEGVETEFVDNMARGLDAWTSAAGRDLIRWGLLVFKKPDKDPESPADIKAISATAQAYYDSDNAFNFYRQVWGGEHIHVGLYTKLEGDDAKLEGVPRITKASSLTTDALLSRCFPEGSPPASESTMMDMGSGYGGTARVAAKTLGCKVVCINVASRENAVNADLTKAAGLEDKVIIPGEKSFFETGMPDASCDVVTSQDALLHAGSERHRALGEAARVLKPGGRMVFSDIMQSEEADAKDLKEVYQRIHLDDMATPKAYAKWGKQHGLEFVEFTDLTANIEIHYGSVREVLVSQRGKLEGVETEFVDNMAKGLDAWTSAAGRDLIRWGLLVFKKPVQVGTD
eukprot:g12674.t1